VNWLRVPVAVLKLEQALVIGGPLDSKTGLPAISTRTRFHPCLLVPLGHDNFPAVFDLLNRVTQMSDRMRVY
jgi:hypothetical protein